MILWSDDNISISMIFNNLTGQTLKRMNTKPISVTLLLEKWDLCQARLNFIKEVY